MVDEVTSSAMPGDGLLIMPILHFAMVVAQYSITDLNC